MAQEPRNLSTEKAPITFDHGPIATARSLSPAITALLFAVTPGAAVEDEPGVAQPPTVCADRTTFLRPEEARAGSRTGLLSRLFPAGDVFRPLLADMKEPRFYASLRWVDFEGPALPAGGEDNITAGLVALGQSFGVWGLRDPAGCSGIQVSLIGGAFSQFNLDAPSKDLINTDFIAGVQVAGRVGRGSARVRLFHQSSHLGDEFLLNNPKIDRENLSLEAVDVFLSVDGRLWRLFWRFYGGGGYIFNIDPDLDRGLAQWGVELEGPARPFIKETELRPVLGANFRSFEERDWTVTTSLKGGVEWDAGGTRRVRLLAVYLDGFIPFGQFFSTTKLTNFGLEAQFEF